MGISHTLSRHFFWRDNILWKEDLEGRKVGVVLSGEDQIVDAREVWKYLTGQKDKEPNGLWEDEKVCLHYSGKHLSDYLEKEDLSVLWFPGLDHAQVFDTPERRRPVLQLVEKLTTAR
jgi:hypothetical protein